MYLVCLECFGLLYRVVSGEASQNHISGLGGSPRTPMQYASGPVMLASMGPCRGLKLLLRGKNDGVEGS